MTRTETVVRARADCVGLGIQARAQALSLGWSRRRAEELGLVVIELTNNAVRHAGGGTCALEIEHGRATFEVSDAGPGIPAWVLERVDPTKEPVEAPRSLSGLGAGLDSARRLSDELSLANLPGGGARVRSVCILRRKGTKT